MPILKIGDFLLVSIQYDIHDKIAELLQQDILKRISETQAKGVLVDISALETVDSFIARSLADTAAMASILDAELIIVGMSPTVATTLTELGLTMAGVRAAVNLDEGYDLLKASLGQRVVDRRNR
ncbi:STAS domain-containing protein [candidate division WOR-3 bacterium]|nr:STAS domain-containing protein [candidate division WOR-3 bacterium]